MDKRIVAIVGLIGGILVAVGVFGTWLSVAGQSGSGWDLTKAPPTGANAKLPYIALVGGILVIVGSVVAMVKANVVPKVLLMIGAILGFIGISLGVAVFDSTVAEMSVSYGVYLCVIGNILALLAMLGLGEVK